MEKSVERFFNKMLTKEEWDNPDFILFSNTEIPPGNIKLGTRLNEIIQQYKLPDNIPVSEHISD
jgi:hypothetical protein